MPISIIIQHNDPLSIENQLKQTNKFRHTELGEPINYDQRRISWKCRYLFQPLCHSVDLPEKKCHIFIWVLVYAIPSEVIKKLLEQSDDEVTHIEHIIQINLEVGNNPLLNPVQCLILLLHPFDKIWI